MWSESLTGENMRRIVTFAIIIMFSVGAYAQEAVAPTSTSTVDVNSPEVKKAIADAVAKAVASQKPATPTPEQLKAAYKQVFEKAKSVDNVFGVACKEAGGKELLVSISGGQALQECLVPLR